MVSVMFGVWTMLVTMMQRNPERTKAVEIQMIEVSFFTSVLSMGWWFCSVSTKGMLHNDLLHHSLSQCLYSVWLFEQPQRYSKVSKWDGPKVLWIDKPLCMACVDGNNLEINYSVNIGFPSVCHFHSFIKNALNWLGSLVLCSIKSSSMRICKLIE